MCQKRNYKILQLQKLDVTGLTVLIKKESFYCCITNFGKVYEKSHAINGNWFIAIQDKQIKIAWSVNVEIDFLSDLVERLKNRNSMRRLILVWYWSGMFFLFKVEIDSIIALNPELQASPVKIMPPPSMLSKGRVRLTLVRTNFLGWWSNTGMH